MTPGATESYKLFPPRAWGMVRPVDRQRKAQFVFPTRVGMVPNATSDGRFGLRVGMVRHQRNSSLGARVFPTRVGMVRSI